MNKTNNNITYKILAILLISTIGLWTASNSIFYHAHLMSNGKIVYHAHPYNKTTDSTPYKSHKHSDAQLSVIDHLYITIFAIIVQFSIILTVRHFKYTQQKFGFSGTNICNTLGRSPPIALLA